MDTIWIKCGYMHLDTIWIHLEARGCWEASEALNIDPTPTPNAKIPKMLTDVLYQMHSRLENTVNYKGKSQNWPNGCRLTKHRSHPGAPRTTQEAWGTERAPSGHRWTKMCQKCETVVRNRAPPLGTAESTRTWRAPPWSLI